MLSGSVRRLVDIPSSVMVFYQVPFTDKKVKLLNVNADETEHRLVYPH
jgi:hypothetical protein